MHLIPALQSADGDRVQARLNQPSESPWEAKAVREADEEKIALADGNNSGRHPRYGCLNPESPRSCSHARAASEFNTGREHASTPATTSLQTIPLDADQEHDGEKLSTAQNKRCSGPEDHSDLSQDNPVTHEILRNAETDLHKKHLFTMHDGDSNNQRNRWALTSVISETDQDRQGGKANTFSGLLSSSKSSCVEIPLETHHGPGSPGLSAAYSVRSRSDSVSESGETFDSGTTASVSSMVLGQTHPRISPQAEAFNNLANDFQTHAGDSNETEGQVSQASKTLGSRRSSRTGHATGSSSKRKHVDEPDEDEQESDEDKQEPEAKKNKTIAPEEPQKWACPFQKRNPFKWRCEEKSRGFPDWGLLLDHLKDEHIRPPNYCPVCGKDFKSAKLRDIHIWQSRGNEPGAALLCPRVENVRFPAGIPPDKQNDKCLSKHGPRRKDGLERKWHAIWEMVFPDDRRQKTCYFEFSINSENSVDRMSSLLETEGTKLLGKLMVEHRLIVGPVQGENASGIAHEGVGIQMLNTYFPGLFRELGQIMRDLKDANDVQPTGSSGTGSAD